MQDRFKFRVKFETDGNTEIFDVESIDFTHRQIFFRRDDNILYNIGFEAGDVELIQCTGLKAKNGKLIFEGDIVHKSGSKFNGEKILSEITWSNESAHFNYSDYFGIGGSHEFRTGTAAKMEVLGNIYENPEILKGVNR